MAFTTSQAGIDLIKSFEDCRLTAYEIVSVYGRLDTDILTEFMQG